jgi:hypothetical protein
VCGESVVRGGERRGDSRLQQRKVSTITWEWGHKVKGGRKGREGKF